MCWRIEIEVHKEIVFKLTYFLNLSEIARLEPRIEEDGAFFDVAWREHNRILGKILLLKHCKFIFKLYV